MDDRAASIRYNKSKSNFYPVTMLVTISAIISALKLIWRAALSLFFIFGWMPPFDAILRGNILQANDGGVLVGILVIWFGYAAFHIHEKLPLYRVGFRGLLVAIFYIAAFLSFAFYAVPPNLSYIPVSRIPAVGYIPITNSTSAFNFNTANLLVRGHYSPELKTVFLDSVPSRTYVVLNFSNQIFVPNKATPVEPLQPSTLALPNTGITISFGTQTIPLYWFLNILIEQPSETQLTLALGFSVTMLILGTVLALKNRHSEITPVNLMPDSLSDSVIE